jgi:hypothetical protein
MPDPRKPHRDRDSYRAHTSLVFLYIPKTILFFMMIVLFYVTWSAYSTVPFRRINCKPTSLLLCDRQRITFLRLALKNKNKLPLTLILLVSSFSSFHLVLGFVTKPKPSTEVNPLYQECKPQCQRNHREKIKMTHRTANTHT